MNEKLEQIRMQQKNSWNEFSAGWKKWNDFTMDFLKPTGDEMIRVLQLNEHDHVLDIAGGTGEPALSIAAIVKHGDVTIFDLAEEMLAVARENANKRGIKNIQTVAGDVCELPFPDNHFDAISSRFGFMFFPDMQIAANEMARVLKPGGRIAVAVWNIPAKNFWITAVMNAIKNNVALPPRPDDAPGMFRCAKDGLMKGLFSNAGFKNIKQVEVDGKLRCESAEQYWLMQIELGAPIAAILNKASDEVRKKIKADTIKAINNKFPDGHIEIDSSALVIYGEK